MLVFRGVNQKSHHQLAFEKMHPSVVFIIFMIFIFFAYGMDHPINRNFASPEQLPWLVPMPKSPFSKCSQSELPGGGDPPEVLMVGLKPVVGFFLGWCG